MGSGCNASRVQEGSKDVQKPVESKSRHSNADKGV